MYKTLTDGKKKTLIIAENQRFTEEDIASLKQQGIYYDKGVFAVKVEERINNNPLFILGIEDDGNIYFDANGGTHFDCGWAGDLIKVVTEAIKDIKKNA